MDTEDEAKTKLCPMAFASPERKACAGSLCMAWRTAPDILLDGRYVSVGFCGIAGDPEQAFK